MSDKNIIKVYDPAAGEMKTGTANTKKEVLDKIESTQVELDNKWGKDELEIGGRNLLEKSTEFPQDRWVGLLDSKITAEKKDGYYNIKGVKKWAYSIGGFFLPESMVSGETYTISMKLKTNKPLEVVVFGFADRPRTTIESDYDGMLKFTGERGSSHNRLEFHLPTGSKDTEIDVDLFWVKVEKGTIPTDWTPAPEDLEDKIDILNNNTGDLSKLKTEHKDDLVGAINEIMSLLEKQ